MIAYSEEEIDDIGSMLEANGMTHEQIDRYFEHSGVPGMKWGVRREKRKAARKELKERNKELLTREKKASKTPSFKRDVKLTRKAKGITGRYNSVEVTPIGGLLTRRILGDFKNSEGKKVSEAYANAVINKAVTQKIRRERIAAGALLAAAMLVPVAARRR
jgi:hypothetical protein